MLDIGAKLYIFSSIPILLYLILIPFWLRGSSIGAHLLALVIYIISTTFLIAASLVFILLYSGCLENCYATKKDEASMTVSALIIFVYLFFVYKGCQSNNKKR